MAGVPNFRFIQTQCAGDALVVGEYIFRVRRQIGTKKYWHCYTDQCGMTAIIDGANLVKIPDTAVHNHVSEVLHLKREKFFQNVHQEAPVQLFTTAKYTRTMVNCGHNIRACARPKIFGDTTAVYYTLYTEYTEYCKPKRVKCFAFLKNFCTNYRSVAKRY